MHVLTLSDVLPPGIGGVETALQTLFLAMPDVRFTILAPSRSIQSESPFPGNVAVRPLALQEIAGGALRLFPFGIRRNSGLMTYPLHEWERRGRTASISPDIVHMHSFSIFRYFANLAKRHPNPLILRLTDWLRNFEDYGSSFVFTDHSLFGGSRGQFDSIHAGMLVERLSDVVCVEKSGKKNVDTFAEERGIEVRSRWIPNPIDTNRFSPTPLPSHQRLIVGYAGRFEKKGTDRVIRLIQEAPEWAEFRLALAGSVQDRERLEAQLKGVPVQVAWNVPNDSMSAFYGSLHVFVDPWSFGAPRTALEAMACGRAVVRLGESGTTSGEVPSEVSPVVDELNSEAFFERITGLRDSGALLQMGEASRRFVEDAFSVRRVAQEYHDLYREVASRT